MIDSILLKSVRSYLDVDVPTLDLGCGSARISNYFLKKSLYFGIDVDDRVSKKLKSEIHFKIYDGKYLPFTDREFDQVVAMEVFEHIDDLHTTIEEIHRVLKPGGRIIVTVPFIWCEHETPTDYRRFTAEGLKNTMESYGFSTQKVMKLGGAPIFTLACISFRSVLRSIVGKHISYILMSPFVVLCNIGARFDAKKKPVYSNVTFIGLR